jgi:tetratricopeptide (TPR) repeat protein
MFLRRVSLVMFLAVSLIAFVKPAIGENYSVVLRGKVTMSDGTPPPIRVAVERICSDDMGSKPGPLIDKKGEYIWRMDVDPMRTRSCVIRATHTGYASSVIDISALNGYLDRNINLDPIVITALADDPYAIVMLDSTMPVRAKSNFKAAMKALDIPDYEEAKRQFQSAVEVAPKFAPGWHAFGVVLEHQNVLKEAREAYERAIGANSNFLPPYMTLTHLCIKAKDWECAAKTAGALIQADKKHNYPDIYLHRAVALYGLKDLDNAVTSVQEAIRLDSYHRMSRAEYVYGRILEAKGDIGGAREHMSRYLELDKNAPDAELIRQRLQNLGKPESSVPDPELEYP